MPHSDPHDRSAAGVDAALMAAVQREIERQSAGQLAPALYLVATPIGNLADITLRALSVLARADVVYCEDTRHSAKLLSHYAIRAVTRPFHDHNEDAERDRIISDIGAGKSIAIISDAGTPLVSDPGFKLVREIAAQGLPIVVIPGASAVLTAVAASGLPTDSFFFAGFLPPKSAARRVRLAELATIPGTLLFFEAPQRLGDTLADMAAVLGDRPAAVARELTKLHEEMQRGGLSDLAKSYEDVEVRGEIVVVVGPPRAVEISDEDISERLAFALQTLRLKDAAVAVAGVLGVPKSRVYDLGLKLKDGPR